MYGIALHRFLQHEHVLVTKQTILVTDGKMDARQHGHVYTLRPTYVTNKHMLPTILTEKKNIFGKKVAVLSPDV